MVSCGSKIIKILLGVFNLLWLILGGGIIYIGVKLVKWQSDASDGLDLANINLKATSFVILAIGVVIALISFLGFVGACCENAFMLNAYGFLMILMIAAQIYALVVAIQKNNGDIEKEVSKSITAAISTVYNNTETAFLLESLQYTIKCCGWKGPSDYNSSDITHGMLPASCCDKKPKDKHSKPELCEAAAIVNKEGCEHKLHFDEINTLFKGTIGVGVAVIMFELILVFAACCLAREIRY